MSIEAVKEYLRRFQKDGDVIEFDVSTATVPLAAAALGTEPERIAKSISLQQEDGAVIVVAAGDARIDNRKFKDHFGYKAKMLPAQDVLRLTGHAVGGVCPFALPETVPVYLDVSMQRFETVFPACGTSNSAIELTLKELEEYSQSRGWVDVCKLPEDSGA